MDEPAQRVDEPPGLISLRARLLQCAQHDPGDEEVRRYVRYRAHDACEYRLLPTEGRYEVDHIVPLSLWNAYTDGQIRSPGRPESLLPSTDHIDNVAWACPFCNNAKGQSVAGRARRRQTRLFNPRVDTWAEHFTFSPTYIFIDGLTDIGRATELVLRFNDVRPRARLEARVASVLAGRYPPPWARTWRVA